MQGEFTNDETSSDIIGNALVHILSVTSEDDATYTIYEGLTADANAYSNYFNLYKKAKIINESYKGIIIKSGKKILK